MMNGGLTDMQPVLDILWELLPAFDTEGETAEVPSVLEIPPLGGELREEPVEYRYEGPFPILRIEGSAVTFGDEQLEVQPGAWTPATHFGQPAAVSGGWVDGEFLAHLRMIETPFTYALSLRPTGHLRLATDIGFTGPDLFWEGEPDSG